MGKFVSDCAAFTAAITDAGETKFTGGPAEATAKYPT
jgi:hypothetical protein